MGNSHRDIETLVEQAHDVVDEIGARADLRVLRQKVEHDGGHMQAAEHLRRGDRELALRRFVRAARGGFGLGDVGEDALAIGMEAFADLGQRHRARAAPKQLRADMLFERDDRAAHRRRR